ncbi:hypothetical protein TCAL_04519 [Tigriopus californicus]|uniref:Phosphatidylinositol 3-kinase catalytic subunit type 3 n=1 Tax=Tigriopus californicus TaxID=6832 RepID=A0A553PB32_TIGCA|nr:hypothetical protein TCAL_04519 [Tigriopus californicus]
MESLPDKFYFVESSSLELNVRVKICTLEGSLSRYKPEQIARDPILKYAGRNQTKYPDLLVQAVITAGGLPDEPLHVPILTFYKHFTRRWEWNQWLEFPLKYSDLPVAANLCLTILDCGGGRTREVVGGTTLPLFGQGGVFRQGQFDLRIWNDRTADGRGPGCATPGQDLPITTTATGQTEKSDLPRLTALAKKHRAGRIQPVDWLDRLTFAEVERINQKEKMSSNLLFLMVEFPQLHCRDVEQVAVVYYEPHPRFPEDAPHLAAKTDLVRCPDFDVEFDNIVEAKHHRLARSARAGQGDKDLKPNSEIKTRLNAILSYPTTQALTSFEQDLMWRFRHYLSNDKSALAKFVKCISWTSRMEAKQALDLINKWAPMDVEDALELLGPAFKHPGLRQYAVNRLRQASDEDLQLYLLQLVQALKYEKINEVWLGHAESSAMECSLPPNTITVTDQSLTNSDLQDDIDDESSDQFPPAQPHQQQGQAPGPFNSTTVPEGESDESDLGLAAFLIDRACNHSAIANYLFWYLVIECEDKEGGEGVKEDAKMQEMYQLVMKKFMSTLRKGPTEWRERLNFLERQQKFLEKLVLLIKAVARESGNRKKKIERLQALLADPDAFQFNFVRFDPLELPLDPSVRVNGLVPGQATLFKSSLMPARLNFVTVEGEQYVTLFKHGDDLRQDQLILQIITLMNRILQQENLDLKLTPYRVLATSSKHGFVQFVNSMAIADILNTDGTIQNFFRKHNPSEGSPYGIQPEVMDTYVRSCAGYCVITYLLGVGDRHLDNLLLTKAGKLFHIDFGYILGRDPKVMPSPMKLSKEMIDAFGGMNSEPYQDFRTQCYTAFLSLRRYSNLILNLFSLMVDASVPDIALEPDKTGPCSRCKISSDWT